MSANVVTFHQMNLVHFGDVHAAAVVDTDHMHRFGEQTVAYIEQRPGIRLLLNFERVQYLSSAALTELSRIHQAVDATGGMWQICGVSKDILKIFKLTNMHKLFPLNVKDTPKKALERFQRAADIAQDEAAFEARRA